MPTGDNLRMFRGHSGGGTPGPIPNPEVKPSSADGTAWETVWESRSPRTSIVSEAALRGGFRRLVHIRVRFTAAGQGAQRER